MESVAPSEGLEERAGGHDGEDDDGWLDILGSGQLKKKVTKKGEEDSRPHRGDICVLKYEGRLQDGSVFERQEGLEVQLGDAELVQGLDLAVPLMYVGETAEVTMDARFGFGKIGDAPRVPPSAKLNYTVELVSAEPEPELEELSVVQRRVIGNRKRERGNWWYVREEHSLAIQCYRKALEFLDEAEGGITTGTEVPDNSQELRELLEDRLKVFNNLAAAQMKIKAYDTALQSVENVLRCQPLNVKALFRKGKILAEKGQPEDALVVLREALRLEPENKVIHQEVRAVLARTRQDRSDEKSLYRRMLGQEEPTSQGQQPSTLRLSWGVLAGSVAALAAGLVYYRFKPL